MALANRPTSAGWYLVAFGLLGSALAIALTGWNQTVEVISTMQRRVMPGTHEVALAGGRTMIYYEHVSKIGDQHYESPRDLAFGCTLRDQTGKSLPLSPTPSTEKVRYTSSDFAGRKVFEVDIAVPGAYVMSCDGSMPFVVAIGGGMGAWIVVAIVGGLLPGLAGILVIVFVTIMRRRWYARNPTSSTPED